MKRAIAILFAVSMLVACVQAQLGPPLSSTQALQNTQSFGQGDFYAASYNYSSSVFAGGQLTGGAYTIQVFKPFVVLPDKRQVAVFSVSAPITIGSGSAQETVTPSAVSAGCQQQNVGVGAANCFVTATFTNGHGQGDLIQSGSFGLQEAINDAFSHQIAEVVIDGAWSVLVGSATLQASTIAAAISFPGVIVLDQRAGVGLGTYYSVNPSTLSLIPAPTALTAQAACDATHNFCSDATTVGTWTSGQLFGCIAYVDVLGNEGPCSATANIGTTVVSKAIDVGAPVASTGAVGYTIYLSLIGGSLAQAYHVPLTSSICTLTTIETVTPACAVANTIYGQSASLTGKSALFVGGAVIPAITVNTAIHFASLTQSGTTTEQRANTQAHTTFAYIPGSKVGLPGMQNAYGPFTAVASCATTIPCSLGAVPLTPGYMNFIGRAVRVNGKITMTSGATTSDKLSIAWDTDLGDTTTIPVDACQFTGTYTNPTGAYNRSFTCTILTNSIGATGTVMANGMGIGNLAAATTAAELNIQPDSATAASAALNLTTAGRLQVIFTPTGATDTSITLQSLTLEAVN